MSARSILLACTALTAITAFSLSATDAQAAEANIVIAQAPAPAPAPGAPPTADEKKKEAPRPAPPAARPAPPPAAAPPPPAAAPPPPRPAAPPPPPAAAPPPPPRPAAPPAPPPQAAPPPPPAATPPAARPAPAPAAKPAARPAPPPAAAPAAPPPAAQRPAAPQAPAVQAPAAPAAPVAQPPAAAPPTATPPQRGERPQGQRGDGPRGDRPPGQGPQGQRPQGGPTPPAATAPTPPTPPVAQPGQPPVPPPVAQPGQPPAPPQGAQGGGLGGIARGAVNLPAAAPPAPPTQPRSANEFIRRGDQGPARGFDEIRRDRREVRDGNRTVITEGDRTIVRQGDRTIIRHNEADRFAIGARDVRVTQRGTDTISVIVRPDGAQIVTTTDNTGRLIRRSRRGSDGREVIIIDNRGSGGPRGSMFVDVRPPPRFRGPPERYILDGRGAGRDAIFGVFVAPPIERIDRRYTLEEVRYSEPLRSYMPRVDLDVNFDSGSWQLAAPQIDRLAEIAEGINRAIERNPREVFLIEGHTDATGPDEDNLSLSDRRAEAVAVALTEQFRVPAENLVTQGYGEQYLKVPTDGPAEENRRVAVRRITPLIDQQAKR